jgi:hypothetical protein
MLVRPKSHSAGLCGIDAQYIGGVVFVVWLIIDLFNDALQLLKIV